MYKKIILISVDTLRSDCIPFNPDKTYPQEYDVKVELKNSMFNELCQKGCFFNNAISAAPYTSSSHAAYFTGLWPKNNGLYDQFNSKLKSKNIFEIFKAVGYETIFKTDFPFVLGKYLNLIKGVDNYYIEDEKEALKKMSESDQSLSFFHFGQVHYPYGFHSLEFAGDDYRKKVKQLEEKYKINTESMNLEDMAVETFRSKEDLEYLYRYKKIVASLYGDKKDDDLFNLYLEGINYFHKNKFDGFLKKILSMLEGENYLLVIFADHGEAWDDNTYGHHNSLDEGVIRVPIVFLANDIKSKIYKNRIRTVDLVPTLIELAELKTKSNYKFDGKSLVSIIYDNKEEKDRSAFSAVWVNESNEVLKNVKNLERQDKFKNDRNISIKYSACYYENDFKYIENYKTFLNRSSKIVDNNNSELYNIKKLNHFKMVKSRELEKKLSKKIKEHNSIREKKEDILMNDKLRGYFNLQGYNV